MTEPQPGDRVTLRVSGRRVVGTFVRVITAGKRTGTRVWRLRQRALIQYEDDGHRWETHRDLDAISLVTPHEQPSLFV